MAHQPIRGDDVEAWIKQERDKYPNEGYARASWIALDNLLDDYRLHSDTGVPLMSEKPMIEREL